MDTLLSIEVSGGFLAECLFNIYIKIMFLAVSIILKKETCCTLDKYEILTPFIPGIYRLQYILSETKLS